MTISNLSIGSVGSSGPGFQISNQNGVTGPEERWDLRRRSLGSSKPSMSTSTSQFSDDSLSSRNAEEARAAELAKENKILEESLKKSNERIKQLTPTKQEQDQEEQLLTADNSDVFKLNVGVATSIGDVTAKFQQTVEFYSIRARILDTKQEEMRLLAGQDPYEYQRLTLFCNYLRQYVPDFLSN